MGTSITAPFKKKKIPQFISTSEYFQDTHCKLYAYFQVITL